MKKIALILLIVLFFLPNCLIVNGDNWGNPDKFYYYPIGTSTYPMDIVNENGNEIEQKWHNSILFDLTLFSGSLVVGRDFENTEYYIKSEDVIAIKFYIRKLNVQTNLSRVNLTVTDPNDITYCNITLLENLEEDKTVMIIPLDNNSFCFDKTGLWKFTIYFDVNVTSLIWRHVGNYIFQTFKPIMYYKEIMDPLIFLDYYSEEIPVITVSDALQVTNIETMKQQTDYLNKSAVAQEKSSKQQKDLANATVILAGFTALMAGAALVSAIFTRKLVIETRRERKRKYIIKMIKEVFDKCISEFRELKICIQNINQNKITSTPVDINLSHLEQNSWIDFGKECPDEFEKIKDYLETKEVFEIVRGYLLSEVEQCARTLFEVTRGIRISLGMLNAKRRLSRQGVDVVFDDFIAEGLAESILREDEEWGNNYTKKIFRKYRSIWVGIKQSTSVDEIITLLQELAEKMESCVELGASLKDTKNKLMHDYVITLGQIEVFGRNVEE